MKAVIFDIQRFCIHDGPGIRTTVFFKGCPLRCVWCHNPESHIKTTELAFYKDKCKHCKTCANICSNHCFLGNEHIVRHENCKQCGACKLVCPHGAIEILGQKMDVDEILTQVKKDTTFYSVSGGGITLSGGEPLFQPDVAIEILKKAKEYGIHTCVETCGHVSESTLKKVAPFVDLFLYDYKETDSDKHKQYTGVGNELILSNLFLLNKLGKKIVLRCPIIPTLNDNEYHFESIAKLVNSLENIEKVQIMAYHNLGNSKYTALNINYALAHLPRMEKSYKQLIAKNVSQKLKLLPNRKVVVE